MKIGLLGILGIVFIVLKLTGYIAWSWIWVLAPFWIGFALFLVFFAIAMFVAVLADKRDRNNRQRRNF